MSLPDSPPCAWTLDKHDNLFVLTLDVPGQGANTLTRAVLAELDEKLAQLRRNNVAGLILRSAKSSGFIAGADVYEFQHITDAGLATELARRGQAVLDHIERLPFPTVAVIHGHCLGGGLELALACSHRIAREDEGTRLGLPEVRLGIHPGFAGTVRLPPLIGHLAALDLILSGRTVSARQARKLGLVDEIVPERHLMNAAFALLKTHPVRPALPLWKRLTGMGVLRPLTRKIVARGLGRKARPDHYPAPYAALELWGRRASQTEEARSLGALLVGSVSRNLVHLFLQSELLKRNARKTRHAVHHVHVVGAGVMGADIAMWSALRGFRVSLQDQNTEILAKACGRAQSFFTKKLKQPRAIQEAMDRLIPDVAGHGLRQADLVIEAVVEKLEVKRELFARAEKLAKPGALLATNTSSIPLEDIGAALDDPSRLVGLHFFNPVAQMQLVEIVRGKVTSQQAMDRAASFTVAIDKLPLEVNSAPGFLVNRVLMPYLLEAVTMVEEGIPVQTLDEAAVRFGMPMGPITLADTVGLDICLHVAEQLSGPLGTRVPERLRAMVAVKKLGRKSGSGFYTWDKNGRARKATYRGGDIAPEITDRLILRLLNEAMACLRTGVVNDADGVNTGMIYGTGFAPFRGGPMHYAATLGIHELCARLERLRSQYGEGYAPDAGWKQPDLLTRHLLDRQHT